MKRIGLLFLLGMTAANAKELTSYKEVADAAFQGKRLAFVIDQQKCQTKNPPTDVKFFSVISKDSYNIIGDGTILLRDTNPAHELIRYPKLGPVTQSYSLELRKDGVVHLVNHILNPATFEQVLPTVECDCQFGVAVKAFGY